GPRQLRDDSQVRSGCGGIRFGTDGEALARIDPSRNSGRHRRRAWDDGRDPRRSVVAGIRPLFVPILAGALAALGTACGPKRVAATPARPGKALVALLPDAETGTTGRALVS